MNYKLSAKINSSTQHQKQKTRSWLPFFIFFTIAAILLFFYLPEIKKELGLLKKVNPFWLSIALFGQFMTYIFTAFIYQFLLKIFKLKQLPGLKGLFNASIISLFFNQTMPSAGISGNTFFFRYLARFNISRNIIFLLILEELLIFYAAMEVIIISLLITCLFVYRSMYVFKSTLAIGTLVYFVFACAIVLASKKSILNRLYAKLIKTRFISKIFQKLSRQMPGEELSGKGIQLEEISKHNKPVIAKAFFFQLLVVAADGFTVYVIFLGIGHQVSPFIILLAFICTKIISILPFLPGALLLYESSMSLFLASAGVPVGAAIIVTLVYRLLSFWLPIPVGTFLYRKWLKGYLS